MKKKRILTIVLAVLLAAGAIFGIVKAVRYTTGGNQAVTVVSAMELNYGYGGGIFQQTQGYVSNDAVQNVYLAETTSVAEVRVKEGDAVKRDDVLLVYDTTQTNLLLEQAKLQKEQIELNADIARQNLETLKKIRPVSDVIVPEEPLPEEEIYEEEEFPEEEEPEEEPIEGPVYGEIKVHAVLNEAALPFYDQSETAEMPGSETNPYRFAATSGAEIRPDFVRRLIKMQEESDLPIYVQLEVHEEDEADGRILRSWLFDATTIEDVADDWVGKVDLEAGTIVIPQKEEAEEQAVPTAYRMTRLPQAIPVDLAESAGTAATGGGALIQKDAEYTKEALAEAKEEQQEMIDDLELDLKEIDLKIEKAEKALATGEVRALIDGVAKTVSDPASPPTDGTPFLSVSATAGQCIKGGISEQMLDKINTGDVVSVTSWMSGGMYDATITEISQYPDTSGQFGWNDGTTSYYPFTAVIDGADSDLENGEWVDIQISGGEDAEAETEGFGLFRAFVREDDGAPYVYKRGEDGLLVKEEITIGKRQGETVMVLSGVTEEDYLAFPYGKHVKEGAKTREGTMEDFYGM